MIRRRHFYSESELVPEKIPLKNDLNDKFKSTSNNVIPLPNTFDTAESRKHSSTKNPLEQMISKIFNKEFAIDDFILIGLIVLLLIEGVADEFLLIILLYLFLDLCLPWD